MNIKNTIIHANQFVKGKTIFYVINVMWFLCISIGSSNAQKTKPTPGERQVCADAKAYIRNYEFRKAINELTKGYRINKKNTEINFLLGKCYYEIGLKSKAFTHIDYVVRTEPDYDNELDELYAKLLHSKLELDKAQEYYQKVIAQYKPKDARRKAAELALIHIENARRMVANPVSVKIDNLGPNINTAFPEYCPVINADETLLFFTTRRTGNYGTEKQDDLPFEDIYMSRNDKETGWTRATNVGTPINSIEHDATVTLSADGQTALIFRNGDIYECRLKGTKWTKPEALPPPIYTIDREPSATFSPDNKTIYFDRDDQEILFDKDIFQSTQSRGGNWSEPKPLVGINTPDYDEAAPFLHPDGVTLYFSSNGVESMGGFDIFKTTLQPDGTWSKPVNLGYPINTPDDDVWFVTSADGKHAYYSSAQESGFGETDIYKITFLAPPSPENEPKLTLLKGKIIDEYNKKPIEAQIYIIDIEKKDTIAVFNSNSNSGEYLASLPNGKNYGIFINAKDYFFRSENISIPKEKGFEEIVLDISVKPVKYAVGKKFILKNIFYDFDKASLRDASVIELERLRKILLEYPTMKIKILSHTDHVGSNEYNIKLSQARAESVVNYLIEKGIDSQRLASQGMGEESPIDTNDTDAGRQNNRRTEFEIIAL